MSRPTLRETHFAFPGQKSRYQGKVRDVYHVGDTLIMVATDRISAFDVVLPRAIPDKGRILNTIAAHHLRATASVVPNWLKSVPDPNVSMGIPCVPLKVEMVVRGYLAGHAWRTYASGARILCGAVLPEGMRESDPFPAPILTPSTKADEGHDEDITPDELLRRGVLSPSDWETIKAYSLALFAKGSEMASKRGLLLVDTKYEFGKIGDQILLMDEVHTPDSSRYFYLDGYEERQKRSERQIQLSKEFVREWLMDNGFAGKPGQKVPEMTDEVVEGIARRYAELYRLVMGGTLPELPQNTSIEKRIETNLLQALD